MKKIIYDVEVYRNFFLLIAKVFNKDEWYVFSFHDEIDDVEFNKLIKFLNQKAIWIGFNNKHYDNVVLNKFVGSKNILDTYYCSYDIINNDKSFNYEPLYIQFKEYLVDLYLFWSKGLRMSKRISLKTLGVQLNHDNIQELPIEPYETLSDKDVDNITHYCKNDVIVTEKVANYLLDSNSVKTGSLKLRNAVYKEYGFRNCFHWDTPKISSEILFKNYSEQVYIEDKYSFKKPNYEKKELYIKDVLSDFDINFETECFKQMHNHLLKSNNNFSYKALFILNETALRLSYGIGGLHSVNKNEYHTCNDNEVLISSDIASLYPTNIINYNVFKQEEIIEIYKRIKKDRFEAKRTKDKNKDLFLKLCLNSVSGLLDSPYSWLFHQEGALKLRLIGQLQLTKLIELTALKLKEARIISANTDGIEVVLQKKDLDKYYEIVKQVEQQFNIEFEHTFYEKIYYVSVNDYIAIVNDNYTKKKGLFVTQPDFGDSVDFLVIPKALEAYYTKGTDPKYFIENHVNTSKDAIYDYCMSPKVDKTYEVLWKNKKQQRLNRVYASSNNNDGYLFKKRSSEIEHLLKSSPVKIFNKYEKKDDYEINYQFYIKKVNDIIYQLTKPPTLFDNL